VQPVGQPLEAVELALVRLGVAVGVEADEDLREVRVVGLDVLAEGIPVLEVELAQPALLDRPGEREAELLRELGNVAAELLVDEHARGTGVDSALHDLLHALEDQLLGVADRRRLRGRRIPVDTEHLRLEGPPMVEREDVELAVIAERHANHLCRRGTSAPHASSAACAAATRAIGRRNGEQLT
jgi:hypothetical protein